MRSEGDLLRYIIRHAMLSSDNFYFYCAFGKQRRAYAISMVL